MVQINFAQKQVNAKVVYYGPGMSGKTTNLEVIHQRAPQNNKGELTSISTDGDRTLFFDFMPLDLGTVSGMRTCFQIYTVPGQVYYNSTRKLVLQGVDGVIFIADSSASMMEENLESMRNLEQNLAEYGRDVTDLPLVIQYNKRDLPDAMSIEDLEAALNPRGVPSFEGMAHTGQGVFPTLKALAANVLDHIHKQQTGASAPAQQTPKPSTQAQSTPKESLLQTGFHPAAKAKATQNTSQPDPTAPAGGNTAHSAPAPARATNATPTSHAPAMAQGQNAPSGGLSLGSPLPSSNAAPEVPQPQMQQPQMQPQMQQPQMQPQMQQPQMQQPQMHQPQMHQPQMQQPQQMQPQMQAAPAMQQVAAPPAPAQAAPSQAQRMQPEASTAPARPSKARSFPTPTTPASRNARPTPKSKPSSKSAVITTLIVVASVGLGAVLGSLILSLF